MRSPIFANKDELSCSKRPENSIMLQDFIISITLVYFELHSCVESPNSNQVSKWMYSINKYRPLPELEWLTADPCNSIISLCLLLSIV